MSAFRAAYVTSDMIKDLTKSIAMQAGWGCLIRVGGFAGVWNYESNHEFELRWTREAEKASWTEMESSSDSCDSSEPELILNCNDVAETKPQLQPLFDFDDEELLTSDELSAFKGLTEEWRKMRVSMKDTRFKKLIQRIGPWNGKRERPYNPAVDYGGVHIDHWDVYLLFAHLAGLDKRLLSLYLLEAIILHTIHTDDAELLTPQVIYLSERELKTQLTARGAKAAALRKRVVTQLRKHKIVATILHYNHHFVAAFAKMIEGDKDSSRVTLMHRDSWRTDGRTQSMKEYGADLERFLQMDSDDDDEDHLHVELKSKGDKWPKQGENECGIFALTHILYAIDEGQVWNNPHNKEFDAVVYNKCVHSLVTLFAW